MGDSELIVAAVALVISVIVGIFTFSQLLAQMFFTAEGQRKCSSSLLGLWSDGPTTGTHRKWRWSEARFETKFVVPEICLGDLGSEIADELDDVPDSTRSQTWYPIRLNTRTKKRTQKKTESILGSDSVLDYVLLVSALADDAPDMVSWLSFLTFLRLEIDDGNVKNLQIDHSRASKPAPLELSWPRIKYRVHSWDFMPLNAPKPFAKVSIHDIAVLVRRTGMVWKTFDPTNGNVSAEGGAHVLTSTLVQGMGLVLEYRCLDDEQLARGGSIKLSAIYPCLQHALTQSQMKVLNKAWTRLDQLPARKSDEESRSSEDLDADQLDEGDRRAQRVGLWVKEIDKLTFGLIPGDGRLGLLDVPFAEDSECVDVLERLTGRYADIRKELKERGIQNLRWGFNDMIYMAPPVLRMRQGGITTLSFKNYWNRGSIFSVNLSLVAFGALLRAFLNGGTKIRESPVDGVKDLYPQLTEEELDDKMLGKLRLLGRLEGGGTDDMKRILAGVEDMAQRDTNGTIGESQSIEKMHDDHDFTTEYFSQRRSMIRPYDLLRAHFSKAPVASSEGQATEQDLKLVNEHWDPSYSTMEMYFSYIPHYAEMMQRMHQNTSGRDCCADGFLVAEAWLTLMWRGYLFSRLHEFKDDFEGIYVPSEYYGSRLPVCLV